MAAFRIFLIRIERNRRLFPRNSCCKISSILLSAILISLNVYLWYNECKYFQSVQSLPHGYLPSFPHHLYPTSTNSTRRISPSSQRLDDYFNKHISHNSLNKPIAPEVHIVHCQRGPFTFSNYLSVIAAFKVIKPSVMILHVRHEPELDPEGYFQFLPDLVRDITVFKKVNLQDLNACDSNGKEQGYAYFKMVKKYGGFVIDSKTILAPSTSFELLFRENLTISKHETSNSKILLVSSSLQTSSSTISSYEYSQNSCKSVSTFSLNLLKPDLCVHLEEDLFPVQIFNADSDFGRLVRWVAYGSSEILAPSTSDDAIVPYIVHYVWLGRRQLDYFAYLSILSSIHVLKANTVYIHGEPPLGEYWERIINSESKVKLINRDFPNTVYGSRIQKFPSHASDFLRADILLRYGGVYADTDVLFLTELPEVIRRYSASACVDWPKTGAYPDVFNTGVLVAAPGAEFLRYFLESFRWYLDGDWSYNPIHIPYKVYEKRPFSLNVARKLQVLCAEDKCHAAWITGYKENEVNHLDGKAFDWTSGDALAIHWTHPDPSEFANQDKLLISTSIAGDIGKMILRRAKLLPS